MAPAATSSSEDVWGGSELARPERDAIRIDDHAVCTVVQQIAKSGLVERIEQWEAEARKGPGGRPKTFTYEALLVAMALAVRYRQPLTLERFTKVLYKFISPEMRAELGIPDPPPEGDIKGWAARYRNVRTRFHAMVALMDPSPYPKNRRLNPEQFAAATKAMTPDEIAERTERLLLFCNQIIHISIQSMPRHLRRNWTGSIGLDATPIPGFARPQVKHNGRITTYSADPDCAWYIREGDHRDLDLIPDSAGKPIKMLKKHRWAYELSLAIMGPSTPEAAHTFPYLVAGMAVLHKPGHAPGQNAVAMLANMSDRGLPADLIGCDRAYTSQKPEHLRLPAQALGYELVLDYKVDELGIKASWNGANGVEGTWYCPAMPTDLVNATADYRAGLIDKKLWWQRIEARRSYEFRAKAKPDAEGHVRLMCPAAGTAPTAICPHKRGSTSRQMLGKTPITLTTDLRNDPPKVCTQETSTFPPEAGDRYLQALPYATPEWARTYASLRNTVEGVNGLVKDGSYEALADSTRRRVRGVAANSVLVAFGLYALNLRKIDTFQDLAVVGDDGNLRKPTKRQRKTKSVQDFAPSTSSGDPPPAA